MFQWDQDENHPDSLSAEIEVGLYKIKLVGLRFKNYKLSEKDFIYQLLNFFWIVQEKEPDIVIGDFNWDSAIYRRKYMEKVIELINLKELTKHKYKIFQDSISRLDIPIKKRGEKQIKRLDAFESIFCQLLNATREKDNVDYHMWPTDDVKAWSKKAIRGKGLSSPDRIIYDKERFFCECKYTPVINRDTDFPFQWVKTKSDHAMLIASIIFLGKSHSQQQ